MKKIDKFKLTQLSSLFLILTCTAYAADVPSDVVLAEKQELVRGNAAEPGSLDPHIGETSSEHAIYNELFETLTSTDSYGNIIPGAANSWESQDSKTWIIHLRENAKWSNGEPVTADDYVYSWRRLADPALAAPYASYLQYMNIENINEVLSGEKSPDNLGISAIDDTTLEIKLSAPLSYLPLMLNHLSLSPVNRKTVEKYGIKWVEPENFVGNGPYTLKEHVVNEKVVVERNPHYWNNDKTVINQVTFLPINDAADLARYRAGEVDMTLNIPLDMFSKMKSELPEELKVSPKLCTYYFVVNNQRPPFNDSRVRNALKLAIDRDVITEKILGQGQLPAYTQTHIGIDGGQFAQPEWFGWTQEERNLKAKTLLAEAGFDENNPLNFTFTYNTNENHKKIAIAASQMWKKNLGIDVVLENQESKTFTDTLHLGNFEVARYAWCADYNEPSAFLNVFSADSSNNFSHYQNPIFDQIMTDSLTVQNENQRKDLYQKAETLLDEESANIPVYYYVISRMVKPYVGGYTGEDPLDNIHAKYLYIKKH